MTEDETDALLQEALTLSGGDIERVARTALEELVRQMVQVKLLEAKIDALPVRNPIGRPQKLGLGKIYAKYRPSRPLGAPNKMGLGISTKELGVMARQIQKSPVRIFECAPTYEEVANIPPLTNKEAAARVLAAIDPGSMLKDEKHMKKAIANVVKRMP